MFARVGLQLRNARKCTRVATVLKSTTNVDNSSRRLVATRGFTSFAPNDLYDDAYHVRHQGQYVPVKWPKWPPPIESGVNNTRFLTINHSFDCASRTITLNNQHELAANENLFNARSIRELTTYVRKANADITAQTLVLKPREGQSLSAGIDYNAWLFDQTKQPNNKADINNNNNNNNANNNNNNVDASSNDNDNVADATTNNSSAHNDEIQLKPVARDNIEEAREVVRLQTKLAWVLGSMGTPSFVAGHGTVAGFGASLFLGGAVRMAYRSTRFSTPEVALGLVPHGGASFWLAQLNDFFGAYIALTGAPIEFADLVASGIATGVYRDDTNYDESSNIGGLLAEQYGGVNTADRMVTLLHSTEDADLREWEPAVLTRHREALRRCFSEPTVERVLAALRAETGESAEWAQRTAALITQHCPLATAATLRLQRELRGSTLQQALQLEARVATRLLERNNVIDHVRARLTHQRAPAWLYGTHADVPSDVVTDLFAAPTVDSADEAREADLVAWTQAIDAPTGAHIGGVRPLLWHESPRRAIADALNQHRQVLAALYKEAPVIEKDLLDPSSNLSRSLDNKVIDRIKDTKFAHQLDPIDRLN